MMGTLRALPILQGSGIIPYRGRAVPKPANWSIKCGCKRGYPDFVLVGVVGPWKIRRRAHGLSFLAHSDLPENKGINSGGYGTI